MQSEGNNEEKDEKLSGQNFWPVSKPQNVMFAQSPDAGFVIGVVTEAEPSSLSLLAAGVAGMAARRVRNKARPKPLPNHPA